MMTWDRAIQIYTASQIENVPAVGDPVDTTEDIFGCPSDTIPRGYGRKRSYSMLFFGYSPYPYPYPYSVNNRVPISKFKTPSDDYLVTEWHSASNLRLMNGWWCIINWWLYYAGYGTEPSPMNGAYHGRGNNFLFVDGHVELVTPDEAMVGDIGNEGTWGRHWNWYSL